MLNMLLVVGSIQFGLNAMSTAVLADQDTAPLRGALFNQMVKELRSEYAAAVTACAQRIHKALAENRHSIRSALDKFGVSGDPGVMQEQARSYCVLHVACSCSDCVSDLPAAVCKRATGCCYEKTRENPAD